MVSKEQEWNTLSQEENWPRKIGIVGVMAGTINQLIADLLRPGFAGGISLLTTVHMGKII